MIVPNSLAFAAARAERLLGKLDFIAPLIARVTLGVVFVGTGWGKLHSLDRVTAFFSELGIPAPGFHAPFVSCVELFGGALLLVGLGSRLASVPLMVSMLVAIATAQREQVNGFGDLFGLVEWTYFALLAWVALAGPGKLSFDHLLFRAREKRGTEGLPSELSAKPA